MSNVDGMGVLAGLSYAMAPEGSKYRKQVDAQQARASKRKTVTPEQRAAVKKRTLEKIIAEKQAWVANCLERGDTTEAQRWAGYIEVCQAKLAKMGL